LRPKKIETNDEDVFSLNWMDNSSAELEPASEEVEKAIPSSALSSSQESQNLMGTLPGTQTKTDLDLFHDAFCYLTKSENVSILAEHIMLGIKDVFTERCQEFPKNILEAKCDLEAGILEAIHDLVELDGDTFVEKISRHAQEEFSKQALVLIQRNLKAIQASK
jgi:hypothetical protein